MRMTSAGSAALLETAGPFVAALLSHADVRAALRGVIEASQSLSGARPAWTTPKNAAALYGGKTFRALDEWARRLGATRFAIAGSPAYRTADLDTLIEETAREGPVAADPRDDFTNVVDLARHGRKAGVR